MNRRLRMIALKNYDEAEKAARNELYLIANHTRTIEWLMIDEMFITNKANTYCEEHAVAMELCEQRKRVNVRMNLTKLNKELSDFLIPFENYVEDQLALMKVAMSHLMSYHENDINYEHAQLMHKAYFDVLKPLIEQLAKDVVALQKSFV